MKNRISKAFTYVFLLTLFACNSQGGRLAPDLTVIVTCEQAYLSPLENHVANFMEEVGFNVLKKSKLMSEHNPSRKPLMYIVALDEKGEAILEFREGAFETIEYSIHLTTRPPTIHKKKLELEIVEFFDNIENDFTCEKTNVVRSENGKNSVDFYERSLKITRGWFEQAEKLK